MMYNMKEHVLFYLNFIKKIKKINLYIKLVFILKIVERVFENKNRDRKCRKWSCTQTYKILRNAIKYALLNYSFRVKDNII